jgi:hypothetical protein
LCSSDLSIDVDSKETFESMRTCFKHAKGTLENLTVNAVDLRLIYSFPYDFDLPHLKTVTLKGIGSNEIPNAVIRGSPKLKSAVCSYSYPSRGLQWDMGRLDRRFVSKIKSWSSDRRSDLWSILQFENFTPEKIYDRCRNTFSVNFFSPDMWEKIVQMENLKVLELAEVSTSYFVGGIPKPSERLELAAVRLSCLEPGELVTAAQNIRQAGCKVSFRAKLPDHSMRVVDDEIILLAQEHDFWTAQKDIDYRGYENSPDDARETSRAALAHLNQNASRKSQIPGPAPTYPTKMLGGRAATAFRARGGRKRARTPSPTRPGHVHEDPSWLFCGVSLESILPHLDPVLLSGCNKHLFCRKCALKIPRTGGPGHKRTCPTCRKTWDRMVPLAENEFAYLQYMNSKVACPGKCKTVLAISDLDTHYNSCPAFNCPAGCQAVVKLPKTIEVSSWDLTGRFGCGTATPRARLPGSTRCLQVRRWRLQKPRHPSQVPSEA